MHDREGADLWHGIRLVEEPVFHANLGVAEAIHGWSAIRVDKGQRDKEMQLDIRDNAVVEFEVRCGAFLTVLVVRVLGGDVELAVLVLNRLRVVGNEWRASPCSCRGKYGQGQNES
ncbi:hypothetical protein [Geobacter metallireducens]|uniref:hypothetical protein n=1 Tax=Geobacter metallireducens TaxID=28232 RepID=UPI00003C6E57|nr:hypothetical protein [Geobacter metallireducens]